MNNNKMDINEIIQIYYFKDNFLFPPTTYK